MTKLLQWEDEMEKERKRGQDRHLPSGAAVYAEAKKVKLQTLHTQGNLKGFLFLFFFPAQLRLEKQLGTSQSKPFEPIEFINVFLLAQRARIAIQTQKCHRLYNSEPTRVPPTQHVHCT